MTAAGLEPGCWFDGQRRFTVAPGWRDPTQLSGEYDCQAAAADERHFDAAQRVDRINVLDRRFEGDLGGFDFGGLANDGFHDSILKMRYL